MKMEDKCLIQICDDCLVNLLKIFFIIIFYAFILYIKMAEYLSFYFDKNDPQFVSKRTVVDNSPTNYIAHVFIKSPIYDTFGV